MKRGGASGPALPHTLPAARHHGRHEDGFTALRDAEQIADGAVPVARIAARLPTAYLGEARLRIDFYRRLALAATLPAPRSSRSRIAMRKPAPSWLCVRIAVSRWRAISSSRVERCSSR